MPGGVVQCFGSGSAWIRIDFVRVDPDSYLADPQKKKKIKKSDVLKCWMFSFVG